MVLYANFICDDVIIFEDVITTMMTSEKKNFKKFQKKIQKFFGLKKIFMTLRPF